MTSTTQVPTSPAAVRRLIVQSLDTLIKRLALRRRLSPLEVHDTRRRLKRARACLALLRPTLLPQDFQACDQVLRVAGRSLARARDAEVMAQTYARLDAQVFGTEASASARPAEPAATAAGTRALRSVQSARAALAAAKLSRGGWMRVAEGLRLVYRRGRRRAVADASTANAADLHAWRRHVKRYRYVLELFVAINPRRLTATMKLADRLSDALGKEHDLALLAGQIGRRGTVPTRHDAKLLQAIEKRRSRHTRRAVKLGGDLYSDRPRVVERRICDDWKRWRLRENERHARNRSPRRQSPAMSA